MAPFIITESEDRFGEAMRWGLEAKDEPDDEDEDEEDEDADETDEDESEEDDDADVESDWLTTEI